MILKIWLIIGLVVLAGCQVESNIQEYFIDYEDCIIYLDDEIVCEGKPSEQYDCLYNNCKIENEQFLTEVENEN